MGGILAGAEAGGSLSRRSRGWDESDRPVIPGGRPPCPEKFLVSLGEGAELRRCRRLGRVGRRRRRLLGLGMSAEQFVDPRAERHGGAGLLPRAGRVQGLWPPVRVRMRVQNSPRHPRLAPRRPYPQSPDFCRLLLFRRVSVAARRPQPTPWDPGSNPGCPNSRFQQKSQNGMVERFMVVADVSSARACSPRCPPRDSPPGRTARRGRGIDASR